MKKFLSFLFSDESKKMIQQFIPNIKKNVVNNRMEEYKETEEEAVFQVVILILITISVLINVSYMVFFKMEFQNLFSKKNVEIIIELFKSNMFVFVLKYISDKNFFKKIYNNSNELSKEIKNRILLVMKLIVFFIIFYIGINLILKIYPKDNSLSYHNPYFLIFGILTLIIKWICKNMLLPLLIIYTIIYFIFGINDFIFLMVIKFIKKIKECKKIKI